MVTDAASFEILRHRLSSIADEGSAVLAAVSTSPVASEANDCNVAIMDRSGAAVTIGPGLYSHGVACMMTARFVAREYVDNPGVRPGDMFLSNDPYHCSPHQTCLALVAPVFADGKIIAWIGAGIHVPDMGGPVPGQVGVGAESIFQEAFPFLPIRIVEEGEIRQDLETEIVRRSRTPEQVSLDLRGLIAACNRINDRLDEMIAVHGSRALTRILEDTVTYVRTHLTQRLAQVPNGRWSSTVWLDYPQDGRTAYYACRATVRKESRESIIVDLSESSPQAPAVVNCGEPGLLAGVLGATMTSLGYGLPLCPEAMLRTVEIESEPGTFVHATWPAGCSKATTAASHAIREAVNLSLGKMWLAADPHSERAIAGSGGFLPVVDVHGTNQRGERFAVPLLDVALSVGYGAMSSRDGIDSAGSLGSPFSSIANVETYEYRYPILYLWRRHQIDSAGLGAQRGGRGIELAITPHQAPGAISMVVHGLGTSVASSLGLAGGQPGGTTHFTIRRDPDLFPRLAAGQVPHTSDDLDGVEEQLPGLAEAVLREGEVLLVRNNGGGGLGDPLERDPQQVLDDVAAGAISPGCARTFYAVAAGDGEADLDATAGLRDSARQSRASGSERIDTDAPCPHCGSRTARSKNISVFELGPLVLPDGCDDFDAILILCDGCGRQIDVAMQEREKQAGLL